jgi:hypothetical protein
MESATLSAAVGQWHPARNLRPSPVFRCEQEAIMPKHQNRPGGPTNLPQHSPDEAGGRPPPVRSKHAQTGTGTSDQNDVADPHPSTEEHYDRVRHPGGAHPPRKDLSTSVGRHDGSAPPPPDNADNR